MVSTQHLLLILKDELVHDSIICQECPIDTYADKMGLYECKSCPSPTATVKKGSQFGLN